MMRTEGKNRRIYSAEESATNSSETIAVDSRHVLAYPRPISAPQSPWSPGSSSPINQTPHRPRWRSHAIVGMSTLYAYRL